MPSTSDVRMNDMNKEIIIKNCYKSRRSKWKASMFWVSLIGFVILIIVIPFFRVDDIKVNDALAVTIGYYFFFSLLLGLIIVIFIFIRGYIE